MSEQEIKAYNAGYDDAVKDFSMWRPASELPPVDDTGDSEWLVVILMNNETLRASYNSRHEGWYREDGSKIYGVIKWWCNPPKEE